MVPMLVLADMLPTLLVLSMLPSVRLKLMLMLSTILMEGTVLDTVFILLVMDMVILDTLLLAMVMDMVLAMPGMGMESVMLRLSPRLMLSMEPIVDMFMDLDTILTPLDTVMVMVLDMDMGMDMDTMVRILGTTNQELSRIYSIPLLE